MAVRLVSVELEGPGSFIRDESLAAGILKLATMTWYGLSNGRQMIRAAISR
jgi:hypothetical protein